MGKLTPVTKMYFIAYNQNWETARSFLHTLLFLSWDSSHCCLKSSAMHFLSLKICRILKWKLKSKENLWDLFNVWVILPPLAISTDSFSIFSLKIFVTFTVVWFNWRMKFTGQSSWYWPRNYLNLPLALPDCWVFDLRHATAGRRTLKSSCGSGRTEKEMKL